MKYMLMIFQNAENWAELGEDEKNALMGEAGELWKELEASGESVGGEALAHHSMSKTVRVRDGKTIVTDGPFVEAKEQLAGYLIVDCETPERALQIAARWPDARYWAMEVRPLMTGAADDA